MGPPPAEDPGCIGQTHEKKYYNLGDVFIKRSSRPTEWIKNKAGRVVVPYLCDKRPEDEAKAIAYVASKTDIPVPEEVCAFRDADSFYLITEKVPGVRLDEIPDDKKGVVMEEIERHRNNLKSLKSDTMGGFAGECYFPIRLALHRLQYTFPPKFAKGYYVLCYGDLSQSNVIVDPDTLKINAIIDWEYAGFYPEQMEGEFYKRPGYSAALPGERDDVPELVDLVRKLEIWERPWERNQGL